MRLVPEDVGFCVVLRDLREHGAALVHSPFVKAFPATPLGSRLVDTEAMHKLAGVDALLRATLHVDAEQLRDEIFGDELVLAYRPGPPGKPDLEQGFLPLRARNAQLLARLVERLNQLARDAGSLKRVEPEVYRGRTYYRRIEDPRVNYYYLDGPVLAAASRESLLRELIDRAVASPTGQESAVARHLRRLGVGDALAALWLNPRVFEPALRQKAATASGSQAVALKALLNYWTALDGVAFSLVLDRDLRLSLAVPFRTEQLPRAGRRLFVGPPAASVLWDAFPSDAIFTAAGRLDVPALVDFLAEFLDAAARQSLRNAVDQSAGALFGKDFLPPLLAALGPDWGLSVAAPPAGARTWFPDAVVLIRVRPGDDNPPADRVLQNILGQLAGLVVFHHNGGRPGPLRLGLVMQGGAEVRYLAGDQKFPPGLQPAFAVKAGYLVLATSPEALGRVQLPAPRNAPARASGAVPLLRFSSLAFQKYLKERRSALVAYSAEKNDLSREEAGRRLDGLLAALQLLDQVEVSRRSDPDRLILTLRVQMVQPLK